jgi:hypothetical protein
LFYVVFCPYLLLILIFWVFDARFVRSKYLILSTSKKKEKFDETSPLLLKEMSVNDTDQK